MALLTDTTLSKSSSKASKPTPTQLQIQHQLSPLLSIPTSALLTIVTPALTNTLLFFSYLQLFLRSYALVTALSVYGNSIIIASHIFQQIAWFTKKIWKRTEPARQKLFFEFMVFILNPGLGHGLCVLLFWPGWWLIWMGVLGWWLCG